MNSKFSSRKLLTLFTEVTQDFREKQLFRINTSPLREAVCIFLQASKLVKIEIEPATVNNTTLENSGFVPIVKK